MVTLEEVTMIQAPIERCFDLARSVEVHLLGNTHWGENATAGITSGLIGMGQRVTWRAKHFGVWQTLTSQITAFNPPTYFQDSMLQGAFQSMQHDHFFEQLPATAAEKPKTSMKDIFRFAAPLPILGLLTEMLVLRRYMQSLLRERNSSSNRSPNLKTTGRNIFDAHAHTPRNADHA